VLPTLTAVLAGAVVAGTASVLASTAAQSSPDQADNLRIGLSDELVVDAPADLVKPTPGTTAAAPTTTTTTKAPATPSTTKAPAPPPKTTTTEDPEPAQPTATGGPAEDQVVNLVNAERADEGCGPLKVDDRITAAAQAHAEDMSANDYFSHDSQDGRTFDQRIRNAGYPSPGAENIAVGARTADQVMQMWMDSPGHRANILNCDLNTIGVGLDRDGFYWVQDFGF
jgi:uncharacterized protein YkwD